MKLIKLKIYFPWVSVIGTVAICTYFYAITSQNAILLAFIPENLRYIRIQQMFLLCLAFIYAFDFYIFRKKKLSFEKRLKEYDKHIHEMLKSKTNLQTKVQKYSDHADKLKLFISDRLLEHIEYDEKFLHFKNIASEVRHNGVISYDKVKTALEAAMAKESAGVTVYSEALLSMRYLWDLLDLSTTDNIALYVANTLYEAEEQYCQQMLEGSSEPQTYSPTFYAYHAVLLALPDFVEKNKIRPGKDAKNETLAYCDSKLWFELEKNIQLLGNVNYIVLLIENLLNNALFYLSKNSYGNKYSRISIVLKRDKKDSVLSIYNPGPLIGDDIKDKIFQLGFSTRRNKENNGKGLGLYFVNQIVKGNEGEIELENISNHKNTFVLRVETVDKEKISEIIHVRLDENDKPICVTTTNKSPCLEYKFKSAIKNIDVTIQSRKKIFTFDNISEIEEAIMFDPENLDIPRWCVEFVKLKSTNKITFRPLNVAGVRFSVRIPTAESRLDVDYHELESDELNRLENPDVNFDDKDMELYR